MNIPNKHRGIPWSNEDLEAVKSLYISGEKVLNISNVIGRSKSAIQKKIKELGIEKRRNDWSSEDIEILVSLKKKGLSFKEISKILERTVRSCQARYFRLSEKPKKKIENISTKKDYRRVYTLNDKYFSTIDTQKKAYWIGFILADGCVSVSVNSCRGKTESNVIYLGLSEKDIDVLEDFKSDICSTAPIKKRKCNVSYYNGKRISGKGRCEIRITSSTMIKDLSKYEIVKNKTYMCGFPYKIPEKYFPGFLSGLMSGDGCVNIRKTKSHNSENIRSFFSGNKPLIDEISNILAKYIGYNSNKKLIKYKATRKLYGIELNQKETLSFYKWLRINGISLMPRKQKIIERFIKKYPSKCKGAA